MSALEAMLSETVHRARWSDGQPACPDCFDGADLRPGYPLPHYPRIRTYVCLACKRRFSDFWGTPLEYCKAPLWRWALAALDGALPPGASPNQRRGQRKMARRLHGTVFADRWRVALAEAGITIERLYERQRQGDHARADRGGSHAPAR